MTAELHERAPLPAGVEDMINALPKTMHPMTQLATGVLYLQQDSKFQKAYSEGIHKSKLWEPACVARPSVPVCVHAACAGQAARASCGALLACTCRCYTA